MLLVHWKLLLCWSNDAFQLGLKEKSRFIAGDIWMSGIPSIDCRIHSIDGTLSCWLFFFKNVISSACFFSSTALLSASRFSIASHLAFSSLTCLSRSLLSPSSSWIYGLIDLFSYFFIYGFIECYRPLKKYHNILKCCRLVSASCKPYFWINFCVRFARDVMLQFVQI